MDEIPLKIIQLSDIHLYKDAEQALLGVKPKDSFHQLLNLVKKETNQLDLIIVSGDLSQDYTSESYRIIADLLSGFNIPIYCIPGNHDDPDVMSKVYPLGNMSNQRHIVLKEWQIILLNSQKKGAVEGYLPQSELQFLSDSLNKYPKHHALIVFHHHPIPVGSAWLDKLSLTNSDELWALLKDYPQVRTILFGHIHQEHQGEKNGIHYYSVPSCCIQFKPKSARFALDNIPPGYRWINLYATGEIKTGVSRLPQYVGKFESNAKGY